MSTSVRNAHVTLTAAEAMPCDVASLIQSGSIGPEHGRVPDLNDLRRVISGEVLAVRYPGFSAPDACEQTACNLAKHPLGGFYSNAPAIGRVGKSYFEGVDAESKKQYYDQAMPSIRALRTACLPFTNPMDQLRLALSEAWPSGAMLECIEARPMFVGLARIFLDSAEALPHQDVLAWDAPPDCAKASELIAQLAANVYLRPARQGGELELWSKSLTREEYERVKLPGSLGLDRSRLESSSLVITPQIGELIIFTSNKTHAVRPVLEGERITVSCFIGVRCLGQPLTVWS